MRMRRILVVLSLLAVFITAISTASAQPPPNGEFYCYPDCPSNVWTGYGANYQVTVVSCGIGCKVRVWFMTRVACPQQFRDIQIYRIDLESGNCTGCDEATLLRDAIVEMLSIGVPPFRELEPDECDSTWRVSTVGCWKKVSIPSRQIESFRSCDVSTCCLGQYRVCRDALGNTSIVTIDQADAASECDFDHESTLPTYPFNPNLGDVTMAPCTSVCGALGIDLSKPAVGNGTGRTNDLRIIEDGSITTFLCHYNANGSGLIELFDVTGKTVAEAHSYSDDGQEHRFQIDRTRLPKISLYYRISFGGKRYSAGELSRSR